MRLPLVTAGVAVLLATALPTVPASAAITACALPGALSGGPSLPTTLSVTEADGTVVSADGTGYQLCVTPASDRAYTIVVALADNMEDLGADNATRIFTLGFSLPEGTVATSAELYGNVKSYTIGTNGRDVSLVMTPVRVTSGTDGDNPEPLQDSRARITGGIRFRLTSEPVSNTVGMWIGASANRYVVSMSGTCPAIGDGGGGAPDAPGSLSVRMWAPHLTAGTFEPATVNTGALSAFIPGATASECFNGAAVADIVRAIEVTRAEAGSATEVELDRGPDFRVTEVAGGLLITVPEVTFSSPTYVITAAKAVKAGAVGTRSGTKATIKVTVPRSMSGKTLVVAEKVRGSYVTIATRKPTTGVRSVTVKLTGAKGAARVRVTLDGKVIASLRL